MKNEKGFTLIEVMVVVLIIAIATTFAVIAFTEAASRYRDQYYISSWSSLLRQSVERSVLRREYVGLSFNNGQAKWYQMQWDTLNHWRWTLWRGPEGVTGTLNHLDIRMNCHIKNNKPQPQLIITSSGNANLCKLSCRDFPNDKSIIIHTNGDVSIS